MKLTKQSIRNQVQDALDALDRVNTIMENLEESMSKTAENEDVLHNLFDEIRSNQIHDIYEIMREFEDVGALQSIPEEEAKNDLDLTKEIMEVGEKLKKVREVNDLINEAIAVGLLIRAGKDRVYVPISEDGDEYWMPLTIPEAVRGLSESDQYEEFKAEVEKRKAGNSEK